MPHDEDTLLDYIRHGEPVGGNLFRGQGVDDPLSDKGWRQMRDTVENINGWQRIISSPLSRCAGFAHWLAEQRRLPLEIWDDLREVGFGAWEGLNRDQLRHDHAADYRAFFQDPVNNRPAGAEPLETFRTRIGAVFDRLLETYPGQHLLIVAHAGVIRATLGHVTQAPAINWYRTVVHNAAITRFIHDHQCAKLVAHNWRPSL
jgi:broad specificity phosphatase PhoE